MHWTVWSSAWSFHSFHVNTRRCCMNSNPVVSWAGGLMELQNSKRCMKDKHTTAAGDFGFVLLRTSDFWVSTFSTWLIRLIRFLHCRVRSAVVVKWTIAVRKVHTSSLVWIRAGLCDRFSCHVVQNPRLPVRGGCEFGWTGTFLISVNVNAIRTPIRICPGTKVASVFLCLTTSLVSTTHT